MQKFKFTLSFMKPQVWVYDVVVEAYNVTEAYYRAFYEFAQHIRRWDITPERLEISYVEIKGEGLI